MRTEPVLERPLFTIAIPTYNRAHWLRDCVRAALAQRHGSFEVLVSDNASNDETTTALQSISDERLVVLTQQTNIGACRNWNACVAAARGRYIVMVSDDDLIYPHLLERCGALVAVEGGISVVVALGDVVEEDERDSRPALRSRRLGSGAYAGTDILLEFLAGTISPQMCTVVMKTELLRANGGFPSDYPHAGDLASWLPLLLYGTAGFVNESCGAYRNHKGSQTATLSATERLTDIHRLACRLISLAEKANLDPSVVQLLTREARRYMARNTIGQITMDRRLGLTRRESVRLAWRWREYLCELEPSALLTLATPIALFIAPLALSPWVRKFKRAVRHVPSRRCRVGEALSN